MNTAIDTIVFDVGWVLVHLDFAPLLACVNGGIDLERVTQPHYSMVEIIAGIDLHAHERGEIGSAQLLDNLHRLAPKADREQLQAAWIGMFTPVDSMWTLARQLSARYRVHLLSNVGELHWWHLNTAFNLRALAHDVLPSFEAGVMKPDADIYRQAEQRFQLKPAATVFIDDLEPNVQAARQRGWHAIQHRSSELTLSELRALAVEV